MELINFAKTPKMLKDIFEAFDDRIKFTDQQIKEVLGAVKAHKYLSKHYEELEKFIATAHYLEKRRTMFLSIYKARQEEVHNPIAKMKDHILREIAKYL